MRELCSVSALPATPNRPPAHLRAYAAAPGTENCPWGATVAQWNEVVAAAKSIAALRSYTAPDDPPDHSVADSLAALERLKNR
jgi:hypothetical protein